MRNTIAIIIAAVAAALVYCAIVSSRSDKEIAPKVTRFLISLLPPVIGNLIIIVARLRALWALPVRRRHRHHDVLSAGLYAAILRARME